MPLLQSYRPQVYAWTSLPLVLIPVSCHGSGSSADLPTVSAAMGDTTVSMSMAIQGSTWLVHSAPYLVFMLICSLRMTLVLISDWNMSSMVILVVVRWFTLTLSQYSLLLKSQKGQLYPTDSLVRTPPTLQNVLGH